MKEDVMGPEGKKRFHHTGTCVGLVSFLVVAIRLFGQDARRFQWAASQGGR
jgi:hypothetical protein